MGAVESGNRDETLAESQRDLHPVDMGGRLQPALLRTQHRGDRHRRQRNRPRTHRLGGDRPETRQSCDISSLDYIRNNLCEKECPIAKHTRIRSVDAARTSEYTFQYSDIDFNQHVNSLRYIRLLLDQWTADFHNEHVVKRFEIAYMNEGLPKQTVQISVDDRSDDCTLEISHGSEPLCRTRIVFDNR